MSVLKGTHIGFSYGKPGNLIHSSAMGIVRVSEGNRYTDNLLPTAQEKTAQVPGNDGTYYFGTYYTQKSFSLSVAFDEVDDTKLRQMRQLFGEKGLHQLIFDELPYKVYNVRVSGTPSFKYIAFDKDVEGAEFDYSADLYGRYGRTGSDDGDFYEGPPVPISVERVFKGEGTINFVAYSPFAYSRYKYIDDYNVDNIPEWGGLNDYSANEIYKNLEEWGRSVNLKSSSYTETISGVDYRLDVPTLNTNSGGNIQKIRILVYNPGDFDTDFNLIVHGYANTTIPALKVYFDAYPSLSITSFKLGSNENAYRINTKLHLIEGLNIINEQVNITGNVYNRYITSGDFFQIPTMSEPVLLNFDTPLEAADFSIDYKYLFY